MQDYDIDGFFYIDGASEKIAGGGHAGGGHAVNTLLAFVYAEQISASLKGSIGEVLSTFWSFMMGIVGGKLFWIRGVNARIIPQIAKWKH